MKMKLLLLTCLLILISSCKENSSKDLAQTSYTDASISYKIETVVEGIDVPWGMAFLPDGSMLISEQKGELIHFINGKKTLKYKNFSGTAIVKITPGTIDRIINWNP